MHEIHRCRCLCKIKREEEGEAVEDFRPGVGVMPGKGNRKGGDAGSGVSTWCSWRKSPPEQGLLGAPTGQERPCCVQSSARPWHSCCREPLRCWPAGCWSAGLLASYTAQRSPSAVGPAWHPLGAIRVPRHLVVLPFILVCVINSMCCVRQSFSERN